MNADLAAVLWHTVELRRVTSGTVDRYGTVTEVLGDAEALQCYLEVTASEESAGTDRERRSEALLVCWPDTGIKARDVIDFEGSRWLVNGEPRSFSDADGPHHTEAALLAVKEGP